MQQHLLVDKLLEEDRRLGDRVMDNEKKVIGLQEKLLESKDSQIDNLTAIAETAVKESVKTYSQTVAATASQVAPVISQVSIRRAVKDLSDSEKRSKNVIVFGPEGRDSDNLEAAVGEVFEKQQWGRFLRSAVRSLSQSQ